MSESRRLFEQTRNGIVVFVIVVVIDVVVVVIDVVVVVVAIHFRSETRRLEETQTRKLFMVSDNRFPDIGRYSITSGKSWSVKVRLPMSAIVFL